jgi:hypothetical protein
LFRAVAGQIRFTHATNISGKSQSITGSSCRATSGPPKQCLRRCRIGSSSCSVVAVDLYSSFTKTAIRLRIHQSCCTWTRHSSLSSSACRELSRIGACRSVSQCFFLAMTLKFFGAGLLQIHCYAIETTSKVFGT